MAKRPATFKQTDVTRAVKGVRAAGVSVGRVEIDRDGRIVIESASTPAAPQSDFDQWFADRGTGKAGRHAR